MFNQATSKFNGRLTNLALLLLTSTWTCFLIIVATAAAPAAPSTSTRTSTSTGWSNLFSLPSSDTSSSQSPSPSIRYGHSSCMLPTGDFLITHGYRYDNGATWLSDTWIFHTQNNEWAQVHAPIMDVREGPSRRYGASAVVHGDDMYFFGGDDGGAARHTSSYLHVLYADFWQFCTSTNTWHLMPISHKTMIQPTSRAQHGAVIVDDRMIVIGGLITQDDTVTDDMGMEMYHMYEATWERVQVEGEQPAPRFGHSVTVSPSSSIIYLFGGFTRQQSSNFDDLWSFTLTTRRWTRIIPTSIHIPTSRGYASLVYTNQHLILFGGARCDPGCVCSDEMSTFSLTTTTWQLLSTTDANVNVSLQTVPQAILPTHRYKHTLVLSPHVREDADAVHLQLFLFGGESFRPSGYWNDVWRYHLTLPTPTQTQTHTSTSTSTSNNDVRTDLKRDRERRRREQQAQRAAITAYSVGPDPSSSQHVHVHVSLPSHPSTVLVGTLRWSHSYIIGVCGFVFLLFVVYLVLAQRRTPVNSKGAKRF